ncbi:MAG: SgcJ/EcaC family oxidoreductase [Gemmatimonadota bacterium]|nr:SgcJ/EcaC family oxidoreductase [Gemmatimonadota bacterium]MDE3215524.1 SgcJ/EcaC family oxidoreductase [Gemmatimonadota bacterium]
MFRPRHAVMLLVAVIAAWVALQRISRPPEQPASPAQVRREVLAVFQQGARAWNAGNLDGFMDTYLPDSETTFITKSGVLHGVSAIRNVYAPRFAPGAQRDSLRFQNVEIDILAPDAVNAIAWYVLLRGDSITARGPTSLVMRRVSGRWRIVHDHSS